MKLKSLRNKPILIEYSDKAISLPPHKIVDIGTNYSASIDRAIKLKDVMVIKEEKSPLLKHGQDDKNSKKEKKDKTEKDSVKTGKEEHIEEKEIKINKKEEEKSNDSGKKGKRRKSGLKTVKDLLDDNRHEDSKEIS